MDDESKRITNDCLDVTKYKSVKSAGSKRMKTTESIDEYIKPTPLPKSKTVQNNWE